MPIVDPRFMAHQRARFMRPDAYRYVRRGKPPAQSDIEAGWALVAGNIGSILRTKIAMADISKRILRGPTMNCWRKLSIVFQRPPDMPHRFLQESRLFMEPSFRPAMQTTLLMSLLG